MSHTTADIRNVALAGHPAAGKTTLFEALLLAGGTLQAAGSVERGNTVSDFDPMEKQRGHSLDIAIASIDRPGMHLNLIDTPGYPDFRGPALSALAAVETVAVVLDATTGVDYGARRMLARAKARQLCRVIVVNKIDHAGVDLAAVLAALQDAFGPECLPLNLPADGGTRVVDCFGSSAGESDLGPVATWHQRILDQVVEINESVMERYLDVGETGLSGEQLHAAFEQCLREGHLVPVLFCSARSGTGVAEWLDVAQRLFPHPGEANPPPFEMGSGLTARAVETSPDPDAPVVADVFKIINDPFVGKIGVFRVYQGTVRRDSPLFIDDGRKPFKVGHLLRLQGKEFIEIDRAVPGDIAAVAKIEELHVDAVLHDMATDDGAANGGIHLAPLDFPRPMFGLAIDAASKGQEAKLASALHKLAQEDPCFHVEHETETNETVIRGLSELHLRINLDRLKQRYGVEVVSRPPRIAYRETIAGTAEGHHRHKKQTGGAGQFGEVLLRVEPLPRGGGFAFVDAVKGGAIPGQFLPAIEKGVRQVLGSGAIAGYPLQDLQVTVLDGKHHSVDSKEVAFVAAGKKAFLDAVTKARPQVLEPIVDLEVSAPEETMGDISGGLAGKRARITGTDSLRSGEIAITAQVPLSELDGYAAELKSATAGRGRYSLDFSHYEPVPPAVQQKLVTAWHPRIEEE
ncbi:elongation factor G [Lysobacter concretionis Ko07 = DSM 16239]|uniref:Elongation factor G n=1 Tax=Lysobacter concretionis Ko07 = DSM 16239 TaxID=1122185 RepID=A0A0A0ELL0_9GAMM|nr:MULTISPECIES: elongation factor G [Lysobacter]KGM51033.1 elongation factor G [Lysobacter concretionis Ko07 = DSM 16239]QOD90453.1 elongation factor G [Lysobacter sp. CW239]